jgi:hypothetical protein
MLSQMLSLNGSGYGIANIKMQKTGTGTAIYTQVSARF